MNCPGKVPAGVVTDALVDFTDILPTFAELGGANTPSNYIGDGSSFASLILGKSNDSSREWTMALGSRAATLENGRVKNIYTFRDRAIRNKRFKAFVNQNKIIDEIYDLSNDVEEERNLIYNRNAEVVAALRFFNKVIRKLPKEDANPKYKKLTNSFYDVELETLQKQHKRNVKKGNHAPKANEVKKK